MLNSGLRTPLKSRPAGLFFTAIVMATGMSALPQEVQAKPSGHLLTPGQVANLRRIPFPVVVPTDLPSGFRVASVNADVNKLVNGDDDSGYSIVYRRGDNTCFTIGSSSGGTRGLTNLGRISTKVGWVAIYADPSAVTNLLAFFPTKGNTMLAKDCVGNRLSRVDFLRVLKSTTVLRE